MEKDLWGVAACTCWGQDCFKTQALPSAEDLTLPAPTADECQLLAELWVPGSAEADDKVLAVVL